MSRKLRIEYPGAMYHVMNRGDQREDIFRDDQDRQKFLSTLGEACGKTEWEVHAYCLMRNHFHLVLETPQPNLVFGMKWLLGVYTKRFNIRHKLCGHLFAGRYEALVVEGSGNGYLRTVCDYVHLNPVRAKLLPPEVALESYPWSSYPEYLKPAGQRPGWLRVDRLLGEKGIPKDSEAGRGQFASLMERRCGEESGADYEQIRRDWVLGSEAFRQELLAAVVERVGPSHYGAQRQETGLQKAQRIVKEEIERLGWDEDQLRARRKGGGRTSGKTGARRRRIGSHPTSAAVRRTRRVFEGGFGLLDLDLGTAVRQHERDVAVKEDFHHHAFNRVRRHWAWAKGGWRQRPWLRRGHLW